MSFLSAVPQSGQCKLCEKLVTLLPVTQKPERPLTIATRLITPINIFEGATSDRLKSKKQSLRQL